MTQEATPERDPIEEWWATHGNPRCIIDKGTVWYIDTSDQVCVPMYEIEYQEDDPWVNGHNAFRAITFALVFMLGFSAWVSG